MVHARAFYELRVVPWSVYTAVSFKVLIAVFDRWFLFSRQGGETFICVSVDRRSSCNKQTLGASFTAAWMEGEARKDVCDACVAYGLQCRMSLQLLYFDIHLNNHAHATPLQIQIHCRSKRQRPKSKVVDSLELQGHVAGGEADKSRGHIAAGAGAGAAYCWSCGEPPTDHRHRGWLRRSELELQRQVDDKHSPLRKGKWTKVETLSTLYHSSLSFPVKP